MKTSTTLRAFALVITLGIPASVLHAQTVFYSWNDPLGSTGYDYGSAIAVDNLGNQYTTGSFRNTVDFDPGAGTANLTSAGAEDIFVLKTDANGSYVWAVRMGGTGSDIGNEIAIDGNGNVYVAGEFESTVDFDPGAGTSNLTSPAGTASFIQKLTPSGNLSWARMIGSNLGTRATGLVADAGGVVHVAGVFSGTADLDPGAATLTAITAGQTDFYIEELDSAGIMVWAKNFGGSSLDQMEAIAQDVNGDLYITGFFSGTADFEPGSGSTTLTASGNDIFVAKYSSTGTLDWARKMGGSGTDGGADITVDYLGTVYTTGYFDGTADFDPGNGTTNFTAGTGISDAFVSCLSTTGTFNWAAQLGGNSVDAGQSIALDIAGNVYTTGRFSATADFDPSASTNTLTSSGTYDVFISKLSSGGNYVWAHHIGGPSNDVGNALAIDVNDNVYVTGYFAGSCDFDPQGTTAYFTSAGQDDMFLVKFSQSGVGINEPGAVNFVEVFPNPTDGPLTVTCKGTTGEAMVRVIGLTGEVLLQQPLTAEQMVVDLTPFASGPYMVEVFDGTRWYYKEVIR